jgi:hypothetical protein
MSPEKIRKKRKDYAIWHRFSEKLSNIPGCPGKVSCTILSHGVTCWSEHCAVLDDDADDNCIQVVLLVLGAVFEEPCLLHATDMRPLTLATTLCTIYRVALTG